MTTPKDGTVVAQCCAGDECTLSTLDILYRHGAGKLVNNVFTGYNHTCKYCEKPVHGGTCCDNDHHEETGEYKCLLCVQNEVLLATTPTTTTTPSTYQTATPSGTQTTVTSSINNIHSTANDKTMEEKKEWIKTKNLEHVVLDESNPTSVGRSKNKNYTPIQSIAGVAINLIPLEVLRVFVQKIDKDSKGRTYRSATVGMICEVIVRKIKNAALGAYMYPDSQPTVDNEDNLDEKGAKWKKGNRPPQIGQDGSLYRIINAYFHDSVRHMVTRLGSQPAGNELDQNRGFVHKDTYVALMDLYNDDDNPAMGELGFDNSIYSTYLISNDIAKSYDVLTCPKVFKGGMDFINDKFRKAKRKKNKSGEHRPFSEFVDGNPWLYYYYQHLEASPNELNTLADEELPENVGRNPLKPDESRAKLVTPAKRGKGGTKANPPEMIDAFQKLAEASASRTTIMKQKSAIDKKIAVVKSNRYSVNFQSDAAKLVQQMSDGYKKAKKELKELDNDSDTEDWEREICEKQRDTFKRKWQAAVDTLEKSKIVTSPTKKTP